MHFFPVSIDTHFVNVFKRSAITLSECQWNQFAYWHILHIPSLFFVSLGEMKAEFFSRLTAVLFLYCLFFVLFLHFLSTHNHCTTSIIIHNNCTTHLVTTWRPSWKLEHWEVNYEKLVFAVVMLNIDYKLKEKVACGRKCTQGSWMLKAELSFRFGHFWCRDYSL